MDDKELIELGDWMGVEDWRSMALDSEGQLKSYWSGPGTMYAGSCNWMFLISMWYREQEPSEGFDRWLRLEYGFANGKECVGELILNYGVCLGVRMLLDKIVRYRGSLDD